MGHKKKEYVGGVNSEIEGARIYDEISIKANGLKVSICCYLKIYRLKQTLITPSKICV